ncbi:MAG: EscU/YscU/HrcU family type III secretion system export apparatus switch protein [Deltaproteobacteria bacterium]|nr:EscU/YscU/HrcU family type III secretion system export apparatus switch protein [Deltaproteobacteria bacterium]
MTKKTPAEKNQGRKKAVALRYDLEKDASPKVVGKGTGFLAEKLLELARKHDIPIHEDAALVEVLTKLDINQEIPESTYFIVAEILAFVYRTNQKYQG